MGCLKIVGVVVSPSPTTHAFGHNLVGHDLVVIRDDLVANSANVSG
jgi:hypothetical protein